ncbi:MAG: hypothetical protein KJ623_00730 [Nanoarchaeota archaeon]|nr:hypothetical protein [Nanoarchaeota archaeon]MBU0963037.1 hypothetical protein [Nanoarchaeota archaeon]
MAFVERHTSTKGHIPYRCYTDERELETAFETKEKVREYVSSIVDENHKIFSDADWLIIAAYGFKGTKVAEVFSYTLTDKWPGNPVVTQHVFTDGKYEPQEKSTCGNMYIILGAEELHRRKTLNLEDFMKNAPILEKDLHPLNDAGIIN